MQQKVVEDLEDVADGAITVELTSKDVTGFDEYMGNLTPENNLRNPWFKEYWETFFGCKILPPGEDLSCPPTATLRNQPAYQQDSKVQFVVDAVYAFAHALTALQIALCPQRQAEVCPKMNSYDGGAFYHDFLLNVSFTNIVGSQVKFDKQGDGPSRYTIYNFRKKANKDEYNYSIVGTWYQELNLNMSDVFFAGSSNQIPTSVCAQPCKVGEIKMMQQGELCCWICNLCKPWEYVKNEFLCEDCGFGLWPFEHKLSCYELPKNYMRWESVFAIIPVVISAIGILLTCTVIAIFIRHDNTPVVKASGRELSYVLLCGILICYLNTFLLLAKPSTLICALQRFGIGFGFSVIYGALLTKTNRISRIFDSASKSAKRPGLISPQSQLAITCLLVSIQVMAAVIWLFVEPPSTRSDYPSRDQVILKCRIKDSSFLLSLVYNMFLITTCTIYAVKTRKIPENFNESKFIGFTMYTTCIIWLAFVPLYFGTGNSFEVQITTLCVSISLSASVALFCLYSPKVYIIIWHPDKNVRKLTMNSATYKKTMMPSSAASLNRASESVRLQSVASTPADSPSKVKEDRTVESEALL